MTVFSFLANQTSTIIAATLGDSWVIETGVTLRTIGLAIDASGLATGRDFLIKGNLVALSGTAMILGDPSVADSDTTIKIDDLATFASAGKGIVVAGGGLDFTNVGAIKTVLDTLTTSGIGNLLVNNDTMISTAGQALASAGADDVITNNGQLTAFAAAIRSTGLSVDIDNNLALVSRAGQGIVSSGLAADITNAGTIKAALNAVELRGDDATLVNYKNIVSQTAVAVRGTADDSEITNYTSIIGKTAGIYTSGDGAVILNNARIIADGVAIRSTGDGAEITNTATLKAAMAILSSGADAEITNSHIITGLSQTAAAIRLTSSGISQLTNSGDVHAASGLVLSGAGGRDLIRNSGWLDGDVALGGGKDLFDNRGGEVTGMVAGGKGNDTYIIDHWINLVEKQGAGFDTVRSSASYVLASGLENLTLFGTSAVDATGNELANRITGNKSANLLTGGLGADIFIFLTGADADTITDFEDGRDRIDLSKVSGVETFADIAAHMTASDGNVVIDLTGLGADTIITLADTALDELGQSDFLF